MRFVRFRDGGQAVWGQLANDAEVQVGSGDPLNGFSANGSVRQLAELELLPPSVPSKILAIGLNYKEHAREVGKPLPDEPLLFLKPPSTLLAPGEAIELPYYPDHRVDYEAELAIVIGKRCKNVAAAEWRDVVLGFTCANDVSDRTLQRKDVHYSRGKSFDTFLPLGPVLVTDLDPSSLRVTTHLNGELKQDGNTSDLIFGLDHIVSFVSQVMTLEPWDIILTGTPGGIAPIGPGDVVEVTVEGIGTLSNTVRQLSLG